MLLPQIERFLRETGMRPTVFGRLAARDPRFVWDLRDGREPRSRMERRVKQFMTRYREKQNAH